MDASKTSREEKIALFNELVALQPGAERKGDTMPYTSLNGHMYSYFTKDNFLALKLPEAERLKFLTQYNTTLVQQYGIIQKEYVTVPDSLLENTKELLPWFTISYEYTGTLKPKATKRSKNI